MIFYKSQYFRTSMTLHGALTLFILLSVSVCMRIPPVLSGPWRDTGLPFPPRSRWPQTKSPILRATTKPQEPARSTAQIPLSADQSVNTHRLSAPAPCVVLLHSHCEEKEETVKRDDISGAALPAACSLLSCIFGGDPKRLASSSWLLYQEKGLKEGCNMHICPKVKALSSYMDQDISFFFWTLGLLLVIEKKMPVVSQSVAELI